MDALWINWAGERSDGNRIDEGGALGERNGPGFGWRNQRVFRVGAHYRPDPGWSLRAGFSKASQLIPGRQAQLAPLAQYTHYAPLGASWQVSPRLQLSGSDTYAPGGSVADGGVRAGTSALHSLSVGIGWTLR